MSNHFEETLERMRAEMAKIKNAPPLEKARTFLERYCAATTDLAEVEDTVRHSLNFNAIPLWAGLEGLMAVLADERLPAQAIVSLARSARVQTREDLPPTSAAAREFLEQIAAILIRNLPIDVEAEGAIYFGIDEVFVLWPEGNHERLRCIDDEIFMLYPPKASALLRCIDAINVAGESYAVLIPDNGTEEQGPFTIYRYRSSAKTPGREYEYERVTDPLLVARVIAAHRT